MSYRAKQYKIVLLGDGGVGKSCLATRLIYNHFLETVSAAALSNPRKSLVTSARETDPRDCNDQTCILEVLDTAGQEEYTALREQWIRDGDVYLLVYSISSRSTFEGTRKFLRQMHQVKNFQPDATLPIILVANKCDITTHRAVSRQEGEALARELGVGFTETSAKEGTNVEEAFFDAVRRLRKQQNHELGLERKAERKNSRSSSKHGGKWKGRLTRLFGSSGKHG
ncbi:putative Ras-2 protein [Seiridium unicorne]|uniref:Ras-2 protein n=1 Tax=Seiridium unicorne TaxID=138068 RepID=A0ABR2V5N7_9PEZI